MKKKIFSLILILTTLSSFAIPVHAINEDKFILKIGNTEAQVFGQQKTNDVAPMIKNDRTMLPARFVAENLGATVEWNANTQEIIIKRNSDTLKFTLNSDIAYINDGKRKLDCPIFVENDRTYTPIRFIVEHLGYKVNWDGNTQSVIIEKTPIVDSTIPLKYYSGTTVPTFECITGIAPAKENLNNIIGSATYSPLVWYTNYLKYLQNTGWAIVGGGQDGTIGLEKGNQLISTEYDSNESVVFIACTKVENKTISCYNHTDLPKFEDVANAEFKNSFSFGSEYVYSYNYNQNALDNYLKYLIRNGWDVNINKNSLDQRYYIEKNGQSYHMIANNIEKDKEFIFIYVPSNPDDLEYYSPQRCYPNSEVLKYDVFTKAKYYGEETSENGFTFYVYELNINQVFDYMKYYTSRGWKIVKFDEENPNEWQRYYLYNENKNFVILIDCDFVNNMVYIEIA